uniref:DUF4124 domain-containing protein n=1 Tax=Seriola dumerili TaxID=41447 RepID=A0A3B4UGH7_SERDU
MNVSVCAVHTVLSVCPCLTLSLCNSYNGQIQYKDSVGQGTAIPDLPEVKRVRETQKNISLIQYKDSVGQGTAIPDLPEVKRVRETQKNISLVEEQTCSDPHFTPLYNQSSK